MLVALLLGVVAGCGGGSDETTPEVTKVVFVKKANFVCADAKRERVAFGEETFNPTQRQGSHEVGSQASKELEAELEELGQELVSNKIIPSLRKQQEELESIGSPAADAEKIDEMLQNMEKGIDEVEQEGFEGLPGNQFDDFERDAQAYGLKCEVV